VYVFGDNTKYFPQYYEVRVPGPSRHYVYVHMIDYPGACGLPEIDADVKLRGLMASFRILIDSFQEVEYLPFFFRQEVFHLTDVVGMVRS